MAVLVIDKKQQPLMPSTVKRARLLLERGRAVVVRVHPFTIRLKDRVGGKTQPVRVKIDPGSRVTGIALVREDVADSAAQTVLWLGELQHRVDTTVSWLARLRCFAPVTGLSQELVRFDTHLMRQKSVRGFRTSDSVRAVVPAGKKAGTHVGRVAVRASGSFTIQTAQGVVQGISHRDCSRLQRADGYAYFQQPTIDSTRREVASKAA